MKNRIVINGVAIEVEGSNVSVRNGTIYVEDRPVASGLSGQVHISWEGDLAHLNADGSVTCNSVHGNVTAGGSVRCGDIAGTVTAGGSVKASSYRPAKSSTYGNHIIAGGSVHFS